MASDLMSSVPCSQCHDPAAKFHCNTCGIAFCPKCKTHHLKSRVGRDHDVVLYAEKLNPKYLADLLCDTHNTHGPQYWCDTCGVPICKLCINNRLTSRMLRTIGGLCCSCIVKNHTGHQFRNITVALSEKRDAMLEELKTLREKKVEWEEVLKEAEMITAVYLQNIYKIEKALAIRARQIHRQVETNASAKEMQDQVAIILSKRRQALDEMKMPELAKLQDQERFISETLQQLNVKVNNYEHQLREADPSVLLQFKQGSSNREISEPPSLHTVPIPVFNKDKNDGKSMEDIFGQLFSNCLIPDPSVQFKFHEESYDLISSIACVDKGLAWVRIGVKKLQLIDREGSVKDTVNTDLIITDFTVTSDGDLLLADFRNRCIMSASKKGKISTLYRTTQWKISTLFRTSRWPTGLCCLHNGDIVVTFPDERKVIMYSRDGHIRQTLDHIEFRCPGKVAISKVNQDLYICDSGTNKLLAVGTENQLQFEYSGQGQRFYPRDVCTDQKGHILIADRNNRRVHILDKEGHFIQYILTTEQVPRRPISIDVDTEGYVWVGCSSGQVLVVKYLQ